MDLDIFSSAAVFQQQGGGVWRGCALLRSHLSTSHTCVMTHSWVLTEAHPPALSIRARLSRLAGLCGGVEGLSLPMRLPPLLHAASFPPMPGSLLHLFIFLTRELAAKKTLHQKNKQKIFGKPLVILLIVNISVHAFFFYLNLILPIVKTGYCRSLQNQTRFIFLL